MATEVVSGRVDKDIKIRVDSVLRLKGLSSADVIKTVWAKIATTGEVPVSYDAETEFKRRREAYARFRKVVEELPACPELASMTDEQMRDMLGSKDV
ncbi:MAG: type II toxin-antitoxin system RelB/DinJ family antitoxin [Atopobiaceae bacterium]|nr:type II toxin-antitoxin system RelB/DinJ family antitoxin [Atopobiaceae bacterium]